MQLLRDVWDHSGAGSREEGTELCWRWNVDMGVTKKTRGKGGEETKKSQKGKNIKTKTIQDVSVQSNIQPWQNPWRRNNNKSTEAWNGNSLRQRELTRPCWKQSLTCQAPSEHVKEVFNSVSVGRGSAHEDKAATCLFIRCGCCPIPNQQMSAGTPPSVPDCLEASGPQTQGIAKPLSKIDGLTVARPFWLSHGIFHLEEGSGKSREANRLNRSLFFWKLHGNCCWQSSSVAARSQEELETIWELINARCYPWPLSQRDPRPASVTGKWWILVDLG